MAKQLGELLGEYLIRREGEKEEKISVNSLCGKDKIVGIYFSAHWCPPCRGFTPLLSDFYKNLKQKDGDRNFEIVFVSWDKDEASFKEYFSIMPWLALPYEGKKDGEVNEKNEKSKLGSSRKRKGKLCKKFRVQGIPKLVILDGETGKTITCDGYARLMDDKNGEEFPWRQKHFLEVIKGKLIKPNKEEVDALETLKGKFTAVYFSAHWCPPCRAFTPELMKTYEKLKSDGKNLEVVFVTSDRSQESFSTYFETMPWLAVPYGDSRIEKLKEIYGVDGIPTVVILDEKGEIITLNGRTAVNFDRDGQEFPWYPKPLNELTECAAMQLNESACLVLFTEGEDEDIDNAKTVLEDLAREESSKGDDQDLFFFYGADDEICDSVRDFANLGENCPLLVILDFPEREVYICPETNITKDIAKEFVWKYFDGTLESRNLR